MIVDPLVVDVFQSTRASEDARDSPRIKSSTCGHLEGTRSEGLGFDAPASVPRYSGTKETLLFSKSFDGARRGPEVRVHSWFARFGSEDEGTIKIDSGLCAIVLRPTDIVLAEKVEAKAVLAWLEDVQQRRPDLGPEGAVYSTFENRKLDSLPDIFARLCDSPQPAAPFLGFR